jgi:hypothetical protein
VREIINAAPGSGSIVFTFDDASIVWVVFPESIAMDADASAVAKATAHRFLNALNPPGRWEGKIDAAGEILESPISEVEGLES